MSRKRNLGALVLSTLVFAWGGAAFAQEDEANVTALDAILVTAGSVEETKRELTSNATVITEEDIKRSTAKDLAQLLNQQGFQTYNAGDGAGTQTIYMRGYGQSSMGASDMNAMTMLLLNGHRTGNQDPGLISLENIERVEILRGPAAIQYGAGAMGGIVNIITKRGTEIPEAFVELGVGSFGRFEQKAAFSAAKNGFEFAAGLKNATRNDYKVGGNGGTWKHTGYDKFNADLDLGYSFLERHRIGIHLNYGEVTGGQVPGSDYFSTLTTPNSFGENNNRAYNTTLAYEGSTESELFSWKAAYTYGNFVRHGLGYADYTFPHSSYVSDSELDMDQFQAQLTYDNGLLSLTGGFDYLGYDYDTLSYSGPGTGKQTDYAGYLLAKLRLLDERLIISAGGRYDDYEVDDGKRVASDSNFTPSVGLAFMATDWLKLRAHYSEGFLMPPANYLNPDPAQYVPNSDLKPQRNKTFEFGADLAWKYADFSLTYFHSTFDDKIISVSTAVLGPYGDSLFRFTNIKGAVTAGFEVGGGVDIAGLAGWDFTLRPYFNLTYLSERKNEHVTDDTAVVVDGRLIDTLASTPELTASFGVTFTEPDFDISATLNGNYMSGVWTQDWRHSPPWPAPPLWVETGGFTVWNLSIDKGLYDFGDKGKLGLRLEANNLFDKEYAYNLDYLMPGANYYIGINYTY